MIRWKVFLSGLVVLLVILFVIYFRLESWVKTGVQESVSAMTGTKTDIRELSISFKNSSLHIRRVEVGSKTDEYKNMLELEDIALDFQFLPLLYKRFVVDEFSVRGIQWGTKRRSSGWIPKPQKSKEPSFFSELVDRSFVSLKTEFANTPVQQLLDFEVPSNPREIVDKLDLKSVDVFKGVVLQGQNIQATWVQQFKELPALDQYKSWMEQMRQLTQNLPQNPQEILNRVQRIQEILNQIKAEKNKVEGMGQAAHEDFNKVKASFESAVQAAEADYEKARNLVSLDALNVDNLSRLLFGEVWVERAEEVLRYHRMLRELLAKKGPDENIQVRERAKGRDIIFITPQRSPRFVWAKSELSVKGLEDGDRQRVTQLYQLKIKDLNSAPKLYGKPTQVDLSGEFRDAIIGKLGFDGFWDYTKEIPRDDYKLTVSKIKAESWPMGIPRIFPLRMESGQAEAKSRLQFEGEEMIWTNRIQFNEVIWDMKDLPTQGGVILSILKHVFSKISSFYLEIQLKLKEDNFVFEIHSDMDGLIKNAVRQAIETKWNDFQAQLKNEVNRRVARAKEQATKELDGVQANVLGQMNKILQQANLYMDEGNRMISTLEDSAKKAAAKQLQDKAGDQLKKVIPPMSNPLNNLKKPF